SKHAGYLLFKKDKEESCRELDRLINELTRAEEKYLPFIEHGYPVKYVFTQSLQISAEKEKVETTIENLHKEVANLKNELNKKNKQIELLTERHKKLLDMHESLLKNHTTLKDDALLENNSNYYLEWLSFIRARKL
ncbi:45949_t:CDS:2, partial [Gigaspora margarita]